MNSAASLFLFLARILGMGRNPLVVGLVSFLSGLWAVPAAAVEPLSVNTAAAVPHDLGSLLAPYMPVIVAAVMGGGTAFVAWIVKTVLGLGIEGFCVWAETWADARLDAALKNKDPKDDAPAMAFTKAVKAMCIKLRAAEKTMPGASGKNVE